MPYLPQFSHLLLDLSQYDPTSDGNDERVRAILLLMKLARSRKVGRFFDWFGNSAAGTFSDSLLIRLLYYALHSEHKLDVQDIYRKLAHNPELRKKTMTIADKLIAQGLSRGVTQGELIGRIKSLQEFLDLALTSGELLRNKPIAELEEIRRELQKDYETRFKKVVKEVDSGGSQ